jgi:hypothetical protein
MTSPTKSRPTTRRRLAVAGSIAAMLTLGVAGIASADAGTTPAAVYSGCLSKSFKIIYNVAVNTTTPTHCSGTDTPSPGTKPGRQAPPARLVQPD